MTSGPFPQCLVTRKRTVKKQKTTINDQRWRAPPTPWKICFIQRWMKKPLATWWVHWSQSLLDKAPRWAKQTKTEALALCPLLITT